MGLWKTQDSCLVLPCFLENSIFWFLHSFVHLGAFKETILVPRVSDFLPLCVFEYRRWAPFNCHLVWVINMFLLFCICGKSLLLPQDWYPVAKKLRKHISHLGIPSIVSSNRGSHFTGHIIKALMKGLQTLGLKLKISNFVRTTGLPWPQVLTGFVDYS